jgi:Zn-dependent M28 family amino/carboxypeptidase
MVTANAVQSPDHDACRDYIFRTFQEYLGTGNVHLHSFSIDEYQGLANVIGIKRGRNPEKGIIIISAHYDTSNSREISHTDCSPGANDNGTGLAAMLEIARVLSGFETEYSVLFAAWDFEEQYTNWYPSGSNRWYTDHVKKRKKKKEKYIMREGQYTRDQVIANINFDMFGNPLDTLDGKPVLWACSGNLTHKRFVDEYVTAFDRFVPTIKAINKGRMINSDHYTFANRKVPSVENLESGYYRDPFYHTSSDNLENQENINFEFATSVARGGFAFLIEKAILVEIKLPVN